MQDEGTQQQRPRKLSFAEHIETGSDETCVIEFSHTPVEPTPIPKQPLGNDLQSPSDIYATYEELFAAARQTPK